MALSTKTIRAMVRDPMGLRMAAPAVLGAVVAILLQGGWLANPLLRGVIDLGSAIAVLGIVTSLSWLTAIRARRRIEAHRRSAVEAVAGSERFREQARARDAHYHFRNRLRHELQGPLTTIQGVLRQCAMIAPGEAIDAASASCGRLISLVQNIQRLERLERAEIEQEPVDLAEVLREATTLAGQQHDVDAERLRLDLPVARPLPPILGDVDLLHQAVYALVDNALKYGGRQAIVEVRALSDLDYVRVTVSDSGPGIAPKDRPHIFEELYRSDDVRALPGSGFGLHLVKVVAERHGGAIDLETETGRFTTFVLRLPVADVSKWAHDEDRAVTGTGQTGVIAPRRRAI